MSTAAVQDLAGEAIAEEGMVLLDGPDGVAVTMTADAAEGTGKSLIRAADKARSQISKPD